MHFGRHITEQKILLLILEDKKLILVKPLNPKGVNNMLTPEIMEKFYYAWEWLNNHPKFNELNDSGYGKNCLDIIVVKANSETNISDGNQNTKVQVWLEGGPWDEDAFTNPFVEYDEGFGAWTHDIELDCGADTFEEAVIKFVERVRDKYGNYYNENCANSWLALHKD